jgi:hypothetical protein
MLARGLRRDSIDRARNRRAVVIQAEGGFAAKQTTRSAKVMMIRERPHFLFKIFATAATEEQMVAVPVATRHGTILQACWQVPDAKRVTYDPSIHYFAYMDD